MPRLARIQIFPFKSLDPVALDQATLLPGGALENDRRYALVDEHGDFIHAKRTHLIQRLRTSYDPASDRITLRVEGTDDEHTFHVESERTRLRSWLSAYFEIRVELIENVDGGWPDDVESPGPTLISTATLAEVASWFPGMAVDEARERFRANLEIDGVDAFWEDRLVDAGLGAVPFRIGEAELLGTNPCARCIVPTRNPRTGEPIWGFSKTFAQRRAATLPDFAPRDRFDHFYRLALNTRPGAGRPVTLHVGDELRIGSA